MSNTSTAVIGDTYIHGNVSAAAEKRSAAVGIALELIKSSCAGTGSAHLADALQSLSSHADRIEEAMKKTG